MLDGHLAIPEDLVEESRSDGLARVRGHNRAPPIRVAEEVVAAFHPQDAETGLRECGNEFGAR